MAVTLSRRKRRDALKLLVIDYAGHLAWFTGDARESPNRKEAKVGFALQSETGGWSFV